MLYIYGQYRLCLRHRELSWFQMFQCSQMCFNRWRSDWSGTWFMWRSLWRPRKDMGMYNLHQDGATVQGGPRHVGFSFGACSTWQLKWPVYSYVRHFSVEKSRNGTLTGWKSRCQECANSDQNCSPQGVKTTIVREGGRTRGEVHGAWGTLSEIKWWNNVLKRGFLPDKGNLADCCVWTCLNAFDGNINIISFRVLNHKHS